MRIKKFSRRFKHSYRVVAMMMITASLLGVSYGYWSDEVVIRAKIRTPMFKLVSRDDNIQSKSRTALSYTEVIEIYEDDLSKAPEYLTIDVEKNLDGDESSIPLEHDDEDDDDCEVYLIDGNPQNKDDEGILLEGLRLGVEKIETSDEEQRFEAKLNISELGYKLIEENKDFTMGRIKIKLIFKQDLPEEEGWQYLVEKEYEVHFIPSVILAGDGTSGNTTAGNTTAGNGTLGNTTAVNGAAENTTAGNGTLGNTTAVNGTPSATTTVGGTVDSTVTNSDQ